MRHKAEWMGDKIRLKLTIDGLLVNLANLYTTPLAHWKKLVARHIC